MLRASGTRIVSLSVAFWLYRSTTGTSTATARPLSGLCKTAPKAATRGRSSSTDGQEVNPEPLKPSHHASQQRGLVAEPLKPFWPPHSDDDTMAELSAVCLFFLQVRISSSGTRRTRWRLAEAGRPSGSGLTRPSPPAQPVRHPLRHTTAMLYRR